MFMVVGVGRGHEREPARRKQVFAGESLVGIFPEKTLDETFGERRDGIWNMEETAADLAEQQTRVAVVERIASDQHSVQDHP